MFASKFTAIFIISMIILSVYTANVNADACSDQKAASEKARVTAETACEKARQVAIGTSDPTKAVAQKACDDAAKIAKDIADKAAEAVCKKSSRWNYKGWRQASNAAKLCN